MSAFRPLSKVLSRWFQTPLAGLPDRIRQRVLDDFAPWQWDQCTPTERFQRAEQRDFQLDPATRGVREGLHNLMNPDSPAYSPSQISQLRGDVLPVKRQARVVRELPPLDWEVPTTPTKRPASPKTRESAEARRDRLLKMFDEEVSASGEYGALARVYARELVQSSTADRSYIGKQIKQAREDKAKTSQGAAIISSIVKDGHRVK